MNDCYLQFPRLGEFDGAQAGSGLAHAQEPGEHRNRRAERPALDARSIGDDRGLAIVHLGREGHAVSQKRQHADVNPPHDGGRHELQQPHAERRDECGDDKQQDGRAPVHHLGPCKSGRA
jgi:hypothetical protein